MSGGTSTRAVFSGSCMAALISALNERCRVMGASTRAMYSGSYMVALISTSNESCGVWNIYARNVFWDLYGDANLDS